MNKVPSGERDAKFEEFLIAELEQLSEAFLRNEEDGEKRVTFLITLAGGVGAALAFLHNHERWPQQGRGDFFVFEAAGAGQAGARFAAVAGQIRQLSDLASQAAKDVGTLVHAVQLETQAAGVAIEQGTQRMEEGYQVSRQASERLQEIAEISRESAALAQNISIATQEQVRGTEGVATSVQFIAGFAVKTDQSGVQARPTIEALAGLAEELRAKLFQSKVGV